MQIYYNYYLEGKNRLFLFILNWILLWIVCYYYKEIVLFFFSETNKHSYFIFTNVTEIFYIHLKLTFFITNQISFIILLYHNIMFLALSLYKLELLKIKKIFKLFSATWVVSILFLYKVLLPFSWSFFLDFQANLTLAQPIDFIFEAGIKEYYQFFISLYYTCLLNGQFLVFLLFFVTHFTDQLERIKAFRKLFYIIFVVFSTLITPPDILSQIGFSFLFVTIYELLIIIKCLKLKR